MLGGLLISVRQLVLPAHCAACGAPAPPDRRMPLCEPCGRILADLIAAPYCPACGRNAGPHTQTPDGCAFCRNYPVRFDAAVRVGPYAGPLRSLILRLKAQRRLEVAPLLGRLMAERLALAPWLDQVDAVVPVPLHWTRRFTRGFNQAEVLAAELAGVVRRRPSRRLRRLRATGHQMDLPASGRPRNVRGAFHLRWGAANLKDKSVLLVDDVMTSGSTIGECTRVLQQAGARAVYVAVVATADYDDPGPW
jgi:ComF family protein